MRRLVLCTAVVATLTVSGRPAQAALVTGASVQGSPETGFEWDTFPRTGLVTLFVKQGTSFLNPSNQPLSLDLTAPRTYDFDLRLNKGTSRNITNYTFELFFDGLGAPGISALGTRDTTGGTPGFSGILSYASGDNVITLTGLRVSSFNGIDEVAEFRANPDGNIDYVGSFQLTVTPAGPAAVPEPASLALTGAGGLGLVGARLRRRA